MTYEFVREEMKYLWLSIPLSVMTIYALIVTDHTALAASALVFALFLLGLRKTNPNETHYEKANHRVAKAAFLLLAFTFNRINRQFREH